MGTYSNPQLEAMGLVPHRNGVDERLPYTKWDRKAVLHAAIRATNQPDKPLNDDMWRIAAGNNVITAVRCNMGIYIIKISTVIPNGNTNGTDKPLPDEYYLCKKETEVWTLKYLTSSEGNHKSNSHLKQASNSDNYSVSTYNEYIPTVVMDAVDAYIFI